MRFPMTTSLLVKVTTTLTVLVVATLIPIQIAVATKAPPAVGAVIIGGLALVTGVLLFAALVSPRAVRLDANHLVIERRGWSNFEVAYRTITGVEEGPPLSMLGGSVRRVAGNGGLLGFTGFFHVQDVGVVRCWATQLGVPTVLVRRGKERPLLLGVDDAHALLGSLRRRAG